MDKNNDIDVTDNISLIKRVLLYMNVTAFRIFNRDISASDYKNSRSFGFSALMIAISEFAVTKYILPRSITFYSVYIIIACFLVHMLIDLLFTKSIVAMAGNYNVYYSKYLFYIFFIFLAIGLVEGLISLNNEIGHVRK